MMTTLACDCFELSGKTCAPFIHFILFISVLLFFYNSADYPFSASLTFKTKESDLIFAFPSLMDSRNEKKS